MSEEKIPFWKEPWKLRAPAFAVTDNLYYVGNLCKIITVGRIVLGTCQLEAGRIVLPTIQVNRQDVHFPDPEYWTGCGWKSFVRECLFGHKRVEIPISISTAQLKIRI